jgi:hypothetical protein
MFLDFINDLDIVFFPISYLNFLVGIHLSKNLKNKNIIKKNEYKI